MSGSARRLIVNADGFGFTYGNNRGILETLAAGVVRSVSVNASFAPVSETSDLARRFPDVSIGIHVNLSVGRPVLPPEQIPSLVDGVGNFLDTRLRAALVAGEVRFQEMKRELEAQFGVLRDLGIGITHWDGHRNEHLLPGYFEAALAVARRFGVMRMRTNHHLLFSGRGGRTTARLHYLRHPARLLRHGATAMRMIQARRSGMRMADRVITPLKTGSDSSKFHPDMWSALFAWLPPGTYEIYCHPGYVDEDLRRHARYVEERERERVVLSDPTLAERARSLGVELITFNEL